MKARVDVSQYLQSKGWRRIAKIQVGSHWSQLWDHPDHQPDRRGCFTTTDAMNHQRRLDKGWGCRCLPHNGGSR